MAGVQIVIGAVGDKELDKKRIVFLTELKLQWIGWNRKYLDAANIERFHALGSQVAVWTVYDPGELRKFAAWGATTLITDQPAKTQVAVSD